MPPRAGSCKDRFVYHTATGALAKVINAADSSIAFTDDLAGRLVSTRDPGNIVTTLGYDGDSWDAPRESVHSSS